MPNFKVISLYLAVQMGKKCHIDDDIFDRHFGGRVVKWFGALAPTAPLSSLSGFESPITSRSRGPPHRRGKGDCDVFCDDYV